MKEAIYIGNKETNEFHSIKRHKPQCNVKRITKANRVEFRRGKDAIADHFDACAHCTRYWRSRR